MKVNESNHQARPVYCGFNLIERDELRLLDQFIPQTDVRKRLKHNESAQGLVVLKPVIFDSMRRKRKRSSEATNK